MGRREKGGGCLKTDPLLLFCVPPSLFLFSLFFFFYPLSCSAASTPPFQSARLSGRLLQDERTGTAAAPSPVGGWEAGGRKRCLLTSVSILPHNFQLDSVFISSSCSLFNLSLQDPNFFCLYPCCFHITTSFFLH